MARTSDCTVHPRISVATFNLLTFATLSFRFSLSNKRLVSLSRDMQGRGFDCNPWLNFFDILTARHSVIVARDSVM